MVDAYRLRSPLDHLGLTARAQAEAEHSGTGVVLSEIAHLCLINIRGDASDPAFIAAPAEPPREAARDASFSASKARAIASFERLFLTDLLRNAGGNVTTAARIADIERRQLGKLLKKHGIARATFRDPSGGVIV